MALFFVCGYFGHVWFDRIVWGNIFLIFVFLCRDGNDGSRSSSYRSLYLAFVILFYKKSLMYLILPSFLLLLDSQFGSWSAEHSHMLQRWNDENVWTHVHDASYGNYLWQWVQGS
jgi:peptidoglycan/LPS O-acetylase OafA/YrhL